MTRLVTLRMSRVVPGPPDVVWELITDWEHQDDWMLEMSDVVVTSEHREGVGVEAEATVAVGPIRTRDRVRVSTWEQDRLLRIEHLGWVSGSGQIELDALADGSTHVSWTEQLNPPLGPLGALGIRLYAPLLRRTFERDLRVLEGLVRARGR